MSAETIASNTPILVGQGQSLSTWSGGDAADAPSPMSLAEEAARNALADCAATGDLVGAVDMLAVVRTIADSVPFDNNPFGRPDNPPRVLAARLGADPARAIYSDLGGDCPQALVAEAAEAIGAGHCRVAVLAGSEAIATVRAAQRAGVTLDWNETAEGDFEDRRPADYLLTERELAGGMGYPAWIYPLFDHALRVRWGHDRATHLATISELWAGFSRVAADNPAAQFRTARDAQFLSTPSQENYPIADPYLKWHVAQDAVNQGAAVVLTSVGVARELGIARDKWVFLHGSARAKDKPVSERVDLSRAVAMEKALGAALAQAGRRSADIAHFDIYSCFPCAVLIAAEILGVDWRAKTLTQTGGLPFFGGPGNNYSMHGIASMMQTLRRDPGSFGLVLANGGFLTKEAVGVYSTEAAEWQPSASAEIQAEIDALPSVAVVEPPATGTVESFTVVYRNREPHFALVTARTEVGRIVARTASGDSATVAGFLQGEPVGRRLEFVGDKGKVRILGCD